MSKNKKKDANAKGEVPIDFQVESKNLQYTITLKDKEIDSLQQEHVKKKEYITSLEKEIEQLKKDYVKAYELENIIKSKNGKIEQQEKDIENLNNKITEIKKKSEEEKKQIETNLKDEIHQLKTIIESSTQKVELANQIMNENQDLIKKVDKLETDKKDIINKHIAENKQRDIKNEIKFSNLKNKILIPGLSWIATPFVHVFRFGSFFLFDKLNGTFKGMAISTNLQECDTCDKLHI